MDTYRVIEVKQSIFADNNQDADRLRQQMKEEKTFSRFRQHHNTDQTHCRPEG